MTEPRSVRVAMGVIAACTAAVAGYALLRIAQKIVFGEVNPALVLWSAHAGYFWRAWTAAYAGGMLGFLAYLAAGRSAERTARVLAASVVVAAALVALQGVFVP